MANARTFHRAEHRADGKTLLVYISGQFRRWNGAYWPVLDEEVLRAEIRRFFEYAYYMGRADAALVKKWFKPNKSRVGEIVDALKALTIKADGEIPSWLNPKYTIPPDEILPMKNGLLWIPHRILLSPTPEFFNAYALPYEFDPDAPPPKRWLRFLDELFGDDEEAKKLLQEWMGYLLTADTSQQKILLMVGPPRSGKGTIGRVTGKLLGEHNVAGTTMSSLGDPHGLEELVDKLAAFSSDVRMPRSNQTSIAIERLLTISGEDPVSVNPKYKKRYTVKLPTRFTLMTNELPKLVDTSGAIVTRLLVLRFRESFLGREDPGLEKELSTELPGILLWALEGRDRLHERGYFVQPQSGRTMVDDLVAMASPISAFIDERCAIGPDHSVEIEELYRSWSDWCQANGHYSGSKNRFASSIRAVLPYLEVRRGTGAPRKREYVGIGLAPMS